MKEPAQTICEPSRETPVFGAYEVVVLGGGPAGIAAAVAAGQAGRLTLLVERYGFLGGDGTATGLSTFCGLHADVHSEHRQGIHGVVDDLLARLEHKGGLNAPEPPPTSGLAPTPPPDDRCWRVAGAPGARWRLSRQQVVSDVVT
jgi:hypothetical protein